MQESRYIDDRLSKRISALRFPLCAGVVLYHSFAWLPKGTEYLSSSLSNYLVEFLSIFIGKQAVLIFFIISGYLLYKKNDMYIVSLKKRIRTLLIPFLLWPLLNLLLILLFKFLTHNTHIFLESLKAEHSSIITFYCGPHMFLNHLWYLRDLMLLTIVSPILLFPYHTNPKEKRDLLHYAPFAMLIIFVLLNIFRIENIIKDPEHITNSLLFFYVGIFLGRYDKKIIDFVDRINLFVFSILICFLIVSYFISFKKGYNNICELIRLVSGISISFYVLSIARFFSIYPKLKGLGDLSFWVYCSHEPLPMLVIQRSFIFLLRKAGLLNYYLLHASIFFFDMLLTILLGCFVLKFFPHLFSILTGKRYKKMDSK